MPQVHLLRMEQTFPLIPWWRATEIVSPHELDGLGLILSVIKSSEDLNYGDSEQRIIMKRLTSRGEWKGYRVHSVGRWRYNSSFSAVIFRDEEVAREEVEERSGEERRRGRRRRKKRAVEDTDARSRERRKDDEAFPEEESSQGHESA